MKIKNQFIISIVIFVIVLIIISSSVIYTDAQVAQLSTQQNTAGNIQSGVSDLTSIANNYFLFQANTQLTDWKTRLGEISDNLSQLKPANPDQQIVASSIKIDVEQLNVAFDNLVSYLETSPRNQSVRILPEFQGNWSNLGQTNKQLSSDSAQLSQLLRNQTDSLQWSNVLLITTLLGLFGAYFLINYLVTYRHTLKSISELQDGIALIGSGNLDYSIQTAKKDEIGELSGSFNQMTTNLKSITSSKKELEKEIAERKKAEEALKESEQRLRFHADNSPLAVVEWDSNFVVTRWAGAAEKMFGWSAAETVGKPIMDLHIVYEPDTPLVERTMGKLTDGASRQVVSSNRNLAKDGRVIDCTWYNSVLQDENGKMVSVMSLVQDNTDKIKAEKELEETNRNLEKIVEERTKQLKDSERLAAIGQVAGMVGHDIRNPLQAIVNELYLEKGELNNLPDNSEKKNLQESISFVEANLFYIDKIVQDLQDYTKPIRPQKQEMNLQNAVNDALLTVSIPSNIQVSISVNENLTKFEADPSIMRRILTNLMQNAMQAMPNGGQLTLSAQKKGKKVQLTIEDTGVGIPEELKSKIFQPLFTTKAKGQGFGLPVVKRLVEVQGGKISFESKEGKGTKFIIELPLD